jgi:hypothetical protein
MKRLMISLLLAGLGFGCGDGTVITTLPQECASILAAPPVGCNYVFLNNESCQAELTCDPALCRVPECANPPEGCTYADPVVVNGCVVSCGRLDCPIAPTTGDKK